MVEARGHPEGQRLLERLRLLVYLSPLRQHQIETRAGFSRGYLSQLLGGNIDLKYLHLMRILAVLDLSPGAFFRELYPPVSPTLRASLHRFRSGSEPFDPSFRAQLLRLYGLGLESLADLSERLARCEDAFTELESLGVLQRDEG